MDLKKLKSPFDPDKISWRVGATNAKKNGGVATKGVPLAYIDARDVMERLDEVCGIENWQAEYPFPGCCRIGIKVNDSWVWKSNGAGETDVEAEKGQYSDAFKRAAVLWGVGRYLYDLKLGWIDLNDGKISDSVHEKLSAKLLQWQKAYFSDTTPTTPTTGAWERVSDDMQIYLKELAGEIKGDFESNNILSCVERIEIARLSSDAEVALWTQLDSKERSTIKSALYIYRADTLQALQKAWDDSPKHAKEMLVSLKDSQKVKLSKGA